MRLWLERVLREKLPADSSLRVTTEAKKIHGHIFEYQLGGKGVRAEWGDILLWTEFVFATRSRTRRVGLLNFVQMKMINAFSTEIRTNQHYLYSCKPTVRPLSPSKPDIKIDDFARLDPFFHYLFVPRTASERSSVQFWLHMQDVDAHDPLWIILPWISAVGWPHADASGENSLHEAGCIAGHAFVLDAPSISEELSLQKKLQGTDCSSIAIAGPKKVQSLPLNRGHREWSRRARVVCQYLHESVAGEHGISDDIFDPMYDPPETEEDPGVLLVHVVLTVSREGQEAPTRRP